MEITTDINHWSVGDVITMGGDTYVITAINEDDLTITVEQKAKKISELRPLDYGQHAITRIGKGQRKANKSNRWR